MSPEKSAILATSKEAQAEQTPAEKIISELISAQKKKAIDITFMAGEPESEASRLKVKNGLLAVIENSFLDGLINGLIMGHRWSESDLSLFQASIIQYLEIYLDDKYQLYLDLRTVQLLILNFRSGDFSCVEGVLKMQINTYNILGLILPERLQSKPPRDTVVEITIDETELEWDLSEEA